MFSRILEMLIAAIVISALVTFFTRGKKSTLLGFLVSLKNLLVCVLIASSVMLVTLLGKREIMQISRDLNAIAIDIHELGRYFMGEIVVAAMIGSFIGFLITKCLVILENFIGSIGEPKSSGQSSVAAMISQALSTVLKAPFLSILNLILALVISVLVASLGVLLELTILGPLNISGSWETNIVSSAWIGAFLGYVVAKSVSKAHEKLGDDNAKQSKDSSKPEYQSSLDSNSPIKFKCSNCNKKYSAPHNSSGKRGKCKNCGAEIIVP